MRPLLRGEFTPAGALRRGRLVRLPSLGGSLERASPRTGKRAARHPSSAISPVPFFSSALSFCVPRNPSSPSALLYCFDFLSLRITMDCSRGLARMQMGLLPGMAGGAEEKGGTGWRRRGTGERRTRRCDVERMRG